MMEVYEVSIKPGDKKVTLVAESCKEAEDAVRDMWRNSREAFNDGSFSENECSGRVAQKRSRDRGR